MERAPLLDIYETAMTIRRCDERLLTLLSSGQARMTYYSPRGQEVLAAAAGAHLGSEDKVVTTYRGLHDQIAAGAPLKPLLAEYLGKETGTCGGKGGPMHVTYPAAGLMVTTGIVGGGLPIANGFALAAQMRGIDSVTVVNFGDGATNIGAFHEALTLASLWRLPVVFLCQNNLYGEKTAFRDHSPVTSVAAKGSAYAIPARTVDGNDAEAVWEAVGEAVDRARGKEGPTLLELMTFRFRGHTFGDDGSYIPAQEMSSALERDSVPRLRRTLVERGSSEAALEEIEMRVEAKVDDAMTFAMESGEPSPEHLFTDVFADKEAL